MKINYGVTGTQRKALVGAISQDLNAPIKYLGAPTFAYEVGGYTIDRNGAVTSGGSVSAANNSNLIKGLNERGFIGEIADRGDAETDARLFEADPTPEIERHSYQAELRDPEAPDRMELFSADNDEDALRQAYEYTDDNVTLLELNALDENYNVVRRIDISRIPDCLTIELPKDGFSEVAIANLEKLVKSKAALIQKALGVDDLIIEQMEDKLRFPWFSFGLEPEKVSAYSRFIGALCAMAKECKRITAKEKPVDNEKYAFRCFLLRLGFIGKEYAATRKVLLANLSGNSAFRNGQPMIETDA